MNIIKQFLTVVILALSIYEPLFAVTDEDWFVLGGGAAGGLYTGVRALAILPNGDLVAGGDFTSIGGVSANNIARWDGATWYPMGEGLDSVVLTMSVDGDGTLYATGGFKKSGSTSAARVASWDGSKWNSIGTGIDTGAVCAITKDSSGNLWCGGYLYTGYDGFLKKFDGTSWSDGPVVHHGDIQSLVTTPEGKVIAAGAFDSLGTSAYCHGIAVINPDGTVEPFIGGGTNYCSNEGLLSSVSDIALTPSGFFVAGSFDTIGTAEALNNAYWNGTSFERMKWGTPGAWFMSDCEYDGKSGVFVGGLFSNVYPSGETSNYLAHWTGTEWEALGSGCNMTVTELKYDQSKEILYVGGDFTSAGGNTVTGIAACRVSVSTGISKPMHTATRGSAISLRGNELSFTASGEEAAVSIVALNGRMLFKQSLKTTSAGMQSVTLPDLGAGMAIAVVTSGTTTISNIVSLKASR